MKKRVEFCKKNSFALTVLSVCSVFAALFMAAGPAYSEQTAVVATVEADYSGGAHSTISVDPVGGPRTAQNNLLPTVSDITVAAYETYFYRLERFNKNNVTKFDINAPEEVNPSTSVLDSKLHMMLFTSRRIAISGPRLKTKCTSD